MTDPAERSEIEKPRIRSGDAAPTLPQQMPAKKPQRDSSLPGQFGRYRLIRPLGSGGMGEVYLADDTQLKRQIALKTPTFKQTDSGDLLERFYREARSAATLRHPHICPVYDVGEIDGRHYISMAYIPGKPLSAFIRADRPQSQRQVLLVIRKLALALQEAHNHGIIHRDLKPSNVIIDERGEPIIMDFGLASKAYDDDEARLTHTGTIMGTPAYMAPEQVEGQRHKIGPATDQYSLGVILYELLTATVPFRGQLITIFRQIVTSQPSPPSQIRPDIDPRVEALCLRMLSKASEERFPSMKAVADELTLIMKDIGRPAIDSSQSATRGGVGGGRNRQGRSKRWPATLMALAGVATFVGVATISGGGGVPAIVRVQLSDPGIQLAIQGEIITVNDNGRELAFDPHAANTVTLSYRDFKAISEAFTLSEGENPPLTVAIVDNQLVAKLGEQSLGEWSIASESGMSAGKALPWLDLLAAVQPNQHNSNGIWTRTQHGHLRSERAAGWPFPQLLLSKRPTESYELEFGIIFDAADHVILHVPAGTGTVSLLFLRGLRVIAWQESGSFTPRTKLPQVSMPFAFARAEEYTVRVNVNVDGDKVRLDGTINNQSLPAVEGYAAQFTAAGAPPGLANGGLRGLTDGLSVHVGMGYTATLTRVRYRPARPPRFSLRGSFPIHCEAPSRLQSGHQFASICVHPRLIIGSADLIQLTASGPLRTPN